jgi:iron complex outermembrane receptor protein
MKKYLSILFFSVLLVQYSNAQDTTGFFNDSIYVMEEVVISIDYEADKTTPISYQNINSEDLENKNTGQEPSFLLSETPSMTVYSDAGSYQGYSYFRLRGIDQTRINMTLDGVPLNEPEDQGVYFSNYPDFFNSIDKFQIQRGVGTTKNGNASFAGSIQYTSPNLYDSTYKNVGVGYGSYNSYRVFGEMNSGMKKNKGLYVRASHLNSDGYKYNSWNKSSSMFYKGGFSWENSTLYLTGFVGNQQNQMAWLGVSQADIDDDPRTNANTNEFDNFTQSLTQLQHTQYIGDKSTLRTSLYYNYLNGNYDFDLNNYLGYPSTEEMYNYAFVSNFTGLFSNYTYETNIVKWTTGIHANMYSRSHTGSELALGELYTNTGYKNEISAFSKINYNINKLSLFADIQYRHTNFNYDGSVDWSGKSWTFLNPKAGLTYEINDKTVAYYSVGRTGREPTRNDIFGGWDDLATDSLGVPDLYITDAEYVVDHELGIRRKSKKYNASLNFFYMDFQNEILLKGAFGPNGLALNNNVESSIRTGIELDMTYKLNKYIKLVNATSYIHSQIKDGGETFSPILTPNLIVNQEIVYTDDFFETGLTLRYQSSSYIDFANENSIDGYFLMNYRMSFFVKKFTLSLLVNNVTNTKYYNNGYVDWDGTNKYFVQAPLNFYSMLSYRF